jgi:predicted RNA-binding protein with RPS1 domain
MTDQERTVTERNELLNDLLDAAQVAVEEDQAAQAQPATQEEEPAAQAATTEAPAAEAPAAEAATTEAPAAEAPAAEAAAAEAPAAEAVAAEAPTAVVETSEAPAAEAPAAEAVAAEAPTAVVETSEAPAAEAPAAEAAAEGATYVAPADEEDAGRPRRVKDLEAGMELDGRVTSIALYGIFVDIGVGRDGLVHISEMSDTRVESPSDLVKIGDQVKVRVKSVEPDGRRISLTMRSKERGEQRGRGRRKQEVNRDILSSLRVGDNVDGTVTGIAQFGVFVDIGAGKDGLVHVSELAESRVEKAEDVVQVGQKYTFKVLEVDADGARISLSLRRAQRTQRMQQLEAGAILDGTISGIAPFGAFVDIGVGRDGLVHISELTEGRVGKVEDAVKVGDKVKVRVIEIDMQSKRISLSLRLEDTPRLPPVSEAGTSTIGREERFQRPPREERPRREDRQRNQRVERAPEVYTAGDDSDEPFTGDATLEDLMSKFGGSKRNDRKRRYEDDEEESSEDRGTRRQRDAIRRTLQQIGDDE